MIYTDRSHLISDQRIDIDDVEFVSLGYPYSVPGVLVWVRIDDDRHAVELEYMPTWDTYQPTHVARLHWQSVGADHDVVDDLFEVCMNAAAVARKRELGED